MNKKQVGAFLKVMSKDQSRPVLMCAKVDEYEGKAVLVATDGYILAAVNIDNEDAEPLMGRLIRREAIERWYKLATGKDRLDARTLAEVSAEDYAMNDGYADYEYPKWKNIIPTGDVSGSNHIAFNAEYAKVLQDLDGSDGLIWNIYGEIKPMVAPTDNGLYLLMPRKIPKGV